MNLRKASALMREVWPLRWPVTLRRFPKAARRDSATGRIIGCHRVVCRTVAGPRGGKKLALVHQIEVDHRLVTSVELVHEWTHAAQAEERIKASASVVQKLLAMEQDTQRLRQQVAHEQPLWAAAIPDEDLHAELAAHSDEFWILHGKIYRALLCHAYARARARSRVDGGSRAR